VSVGGCNIREAGAGSNDKLEERQEERMTRQEVLDTAGQCVNGDRDQSYGTPESSFARIAALWNAYLPVGANVIKPKDVAAMLALLKIARIATGKPKSDNWVDLAGYAACGGEIDTEAKGA
jgi:hypothetical protein